MSDDEFPPMGGLGGDDEFEDDDDIEAGMSLDAPPPLPEGVAKEIITEAPDSGSWRKPKAGDEVKVHYVGTLQSDGTEFDSSRSRGKPFTFTLGKSQVIRGWDVGVATMRKGEVAKFTLAPDFAYGDVGSPPKIPEKATLVFEIELIDWESKDDLFADGGVIKTLVKESKAYKEPKAGDEVLCSMKVTNKDGSLIEDKGTFEYVLGSSALGPLERAVDKALTGMKKGEAVTLTCTKDYAFGEEKPDGAIVELCLEELYETKDCSLSKDKSLMKKQVKEGEGFDNPKDCTKVTLKVEVATDGSAALPGFVPATLEFAAGNGEVCDAIECAVIEMKKGERAVVTCTLPATCKEPKLGLDNITAEKVVLTLELESFVKATDTWNMKEDEKVAFGASRKEAGSNLFKQGRIAMAMERYRKVIDMFNYVDNFKEDSNKEKAKELKKVCELNRAACHLKLKAYVEAKTSCDSVLKDDPNNVKALYRRAQAELGLKNFEECVRDVKKILDKEPQNREARALLKDSAAGQKEEDKKSKGLFGKMCQALGTGPIPEPYKDRRLELNGPKDPEIEEMQGKVDDLQAKSAQLKKEGLAKLMQGVAAETQDETPDE